MTILEKIHENAINQPDHLAYRYLYLETISGVQQLKEQHMTWGELDEGSSRLAYAIDSRLKTAAPIIVYGHKTPEMLLCFIACAKTGRAYVPIDRSVPTARVREIIRSVDPEMILAIEPLEIEKTNVLQFDEIKRLSTCNDIIESGKWIRASDIFYIIFTSGSTGTPKGVQITRNCLDNFIQWGITLCKYRQRANFINQAPFSFDLSVMDLYLSLYLGGTEIALDKDLLQNTGMLMEAFQMSNADVWVSTPSFAAVCLAERVFSQKVLPQLKTFLFCGETLPNRTVERLQNAFPSANIYNTYGPTESTVAVTSVLVDNETNQKCRPLPVGKAKPGTEIVILDSAGNRVEDNEKGEIAIIGDTVGAGYWKDPEKTSIAFSDCQIDSVASRMYRTGDKGYLLDGMLYYCGRLDRQIKLHGYRIELDDIENNIEKLPNINRAAVLPVYRDNGEVRSITAYVEAIGHDKMGFEEEQKLRLRLKEYLPDYMIPKKIVFAGKLPMTQNGKIDRKALAELKI